MRLPRFALLLCCSAAAPVAAQTSPAPTGSPARTALPVVAVLNLRFDGEYANVLEPGDTLVAAAATSRLIATLAASGRVRVVDSAAVAAAVTAAEANGNPCDNPCALAVGRALGAQWVAKGTITKTSNLVWVLSAGLLEIATAKPVLADSYELKGDATRMGPAGAHVFAQRIERLVAERGAAAANP